MSRHHTRLWGLALTLPLVGVLATSCGNGSGGDPLNAGAFKLELISTGQGQVWPYRIRELDFDGTPSNRIINIETQAELNQASILNPVLPVATLPENPTFVNGEQGNHFLYFRFSNALEPTSILSLLPSNQQLNSGLSTSLAIVAYNPVTEATQTVRGRGFVAGQTTQRNPDGSVSLIEAVSVDENGEVLINDPIADGFPRGFFGDEQLVQPNAFVFVADSDENLSTIERFDPNNQDLVIQIRVNNTVLNTDGALIENEARVATTVGADPNPANVVGFSTNRLLRISPGNGETNVEPLEPILIEFNKPVQPTDIGTFFSRTNLAPATGGISLSVTLANNVFTALYYADPVSVGDLMTYRITPAFDLPGNEDITVNVIASQVRAIEDLNPLGQDVQTTFRTGNGRGLVNAPVAPDAVYVGIDGVEPGIAVLDLNGFGQGTNGLQPDANGDPTLSPDQTFFALNNPNIGGALTPPLAPGTSPVDAGSNGPFTLTEDTTGNTVLVGAPLLAGVEDIQIGSPLDIVFNNAGINPNAGGQNQTNAALGVLQPGNSIAAAPHPNPPRLRFPPPNPGQAIFGEEPTSGGQNLLIPGVTPGFVPRGASGFVGPAPPPPSPPPPLTYTPYSYRQQIGHFLYVLDRASSQILVLNSNRMTVLDTIQLPDPVDMAIAPSLSVMAVANFASSNVSIVDIDPRSPTFHEVIATTETADGPVDVVWQPDGEVILAACTIDGAITVINGSDYRQQRIASGQITNPIGMVVTQRFLNTGNTSNLFYAYILNSDGTVTVFESGPDGVNGIGFNDIIGIIQPTFPNPTAIVYDYSSAFGGFWVSHRDSNGVAVVSRVELTGSPQGPTPTQQNAGGFILPPTFRQKEWTITDRIGGLDPNQPTALRLSGNSIGTIAFDDLNNQGSQPNQFTNFNGQLGVSIYNHSSKGAILGGGPAITPRLMFVTYTDNGQLDVIDLIARAKLATIDIPGARIVANYWRQ